MSEEIDIDYEEMEENRQKEKQFRKKEDEKVAELCEESNSNIVNSTFTISTALSVSMTRSGLLRIDEAEKLPQIVERPTITLTEGVKATWVSVSSKCSTSAEKVGAAVKTVCKVMYQHQ